LVGRNAEGYLAPLGTMMGGGMNSGFYRKASPHRILGFDITLDFAYSMAPPGQTTYNFIIPDDDISYDFPFKFPKNLLTNDISLFTEIPTLTNHTEQSDVDLYVDYSLPFSLAVRDILEAPAGPVQNILGTSECPDGDNDPTTDDCSISITFDKAAQSIFEMIIDSTWGYAQTIPGLGTEYNTEYLTIGPLYTDREDFAEKYGDPIDSLIQVGLGDLGLALPVPPGFGDDFKSLPFDIGLPIPILQASVGLPFHTEITARGLPVAIPIGIGTVKYGGFGGKIGISDYLSDILYKPEKDLIELSDSNLVYIIETPPSRINPSDVDNAISSLRLNEINVNAIDSLNYLFLQGNKTVVVEIKSHVGDALLQLENQPKKKKKFPIDLSLGYYTNDLELDFSGATINSTNQMFSLQAGKTLNFPSFLAFLGGVGIYGGIGFESSDLNLGYELANPLAYGCFSGSGTYKKY